MISKCPECGRSYPTHHGAVCKQCVAKKTTSSQPIQNTYKPLVNKEVKVKKTEEVKPVVKEIPVIKDTIVKPSVENYEYGADSFTPPVTENKKSKKPEDYRIEGLMETCPECGTINSKDDMFCPNAKCGKMLLNTQNGGNNKEYPLSNIKGIFPEQVTKLKKLNITTTLQLIDKASTPDKRKNLALKSGIPEIMIYRLVNQADLLRIDGVDPNEAYLLETIGLSTIKVLERRNEQDIHNAIKAKKSLLYSKQIILLPEDKLIKKWVQHLKSIEKLVIPNT